MLLATGALARASLRRTQDASEREVDQGIAEDAGPHAPGAGVPPPDPLAEYLHAFSVLRQPARRFCPCRRYSPGRDRLAGFRRAGSPSWLCSASEPSSLAREAPPARVPMAPARSCI